MCLAAPGLCYSIWTLSYSMWGLVPWPGIEPGPPALRAPSLSHWTTRGVPHVAFQFSRSIVSDSFQPHGLQHARPPCPSPTPRACSNYILCCPLLLLPSVFPSIRIFSYESVFHIWWPKYWSFSFSIGPSNEHSGLISFRVDYFDLFAVPGTLKSLLQHHSSKASILGAQLSLWSNSHIHTWLLEKP